MFRKAPQTSQLNKQKSCTSDVFYSVSFFFSTGLSFNFSASCSQKHWGGTWSNLLPPQPLFCGCLCSGSSSVILIKELSVKELTPVAYKTWEEEKAKLAPEPAGTMIMKEVCALHTTATFQCITQQQLLPHPSYQCLTAPVTSIKRNKSRIFLSETLQGDAGKNKYIFYKPPLSRNCVSLSLSRHQSISPRTIWGKMRSSQVLRYEKCQ